MRLLLNVLSDSQEVYDICEKYWHWDYESDSFVGTVKSIATKHNLGSIRDVLEIVRNNSQAYTIDLECSVCSRAYQFKSRSDYTQSRSKNEWICDVCKAEIQTLREIEAQKYKEEQKKIIQNIREKQKSIILAQFSLPERQIVDIDNLSLRDAIYLITIVRAGMSEDFSMIYPLDTVDAKIAPNEVLKYHIIGHLYQRNLLLIHPNSEPESFMFEDNQIKKLSFGKVSWLLPYSLNEPSEKVLIEEILTTFREMAWLPEWHNEQLDLWYEIGLNEVLEYLEMCLNEHKLPFKAGEKTIHVMKQTLKNFSVGQIYSFIWRATRDAAAFKTRNNTTSQHAANTVVGSIQRSSEKALAEGWNIKPYRRDFRCPQSLLSEVYFNTVIQIGNDGFNRTPFSI